MSYGRWDTRLQHVWVALSYRHVDTSLAVWRASDRLKSEFGRERIFFDGFAAQDHDLIQPGDLIEEISVMFVGASPVVLVFIGSAWLSPRLFEPDDLHRREIEAALANPRTTVIPVLIEGVEMPSRASLPASIASVCERLALRLTCGPDYDTQSERLVRAIERALRPDRPYVSLKRA